MPIPRRCQIKIIATNYIILPNKARGYRSCHLQGDRPLYDSIDSFQLLGFVLEQLGAQQIGVRPTFGG